MLWADKSYLPAYGHNIYQIKLEKGDTVMVEKLSPEIESEVDNQNEVLSIEPKKESRLKRGIKFAGETVKKIGSRNIIIACSMLLIGAAVILNFLLFGNSPTMISDGEPIGYENGDEDVNYIDKSQADAYFASALLSRQQARDQAIAVLKTVVDNNSVDAVTREQATADIERIASEIQVEANIETLIKSKGFEECVAVIGEGAASVIVRSDGLLPNELSQIKEIVWEQAGVDPLNIKIIEKQSA